MEEERKPTGGENHEFLIGVISDTHGILRPKVLDVFNGVSVIVHAGDVGSPEVLKSLREIAPVIAVRGNTDRGIWTDSLPASDTSQIGGILIHTLHNVDLIDFDPAAAGIAAVISGHTHRPHISTHQGVLYVNPGSAGPRRARLPVTVAILHLKDTSVRPRIVPLDTHDALTG